MYEAHTCENRSSPRIGNSDGLSATAILLISFRGTRPFARTMAASADQRRGVERLFDIVSFDVFHGNQIGLRYCLVFFNGVAVLCKNRLQSSRVNLQWSSE